MSDPTHASIALNAQARIESAAFLTHFDALVDPRQSGKVIYPLNEVLLLCLLATLAGAETFVDIALFGVKKRELLRRLLPFAKGTLSHDHLGDSLCHAGCALFPALLCRLGTHRPRVGQLHHNQTHGTVSVATRKGQALDSRLTQGSRMGR